jgi:hypothetical protein
MCKFHDFSPCEEPLECIRRIGKQQSAKFVLGQVVMTAGAEESIEPPEVTAALSRHMCGDWGDVCEEDRAENELSLKNGYRLLSVYHTKSGVTFWIITEWDRSVTTVLLPEEY